MGVSDPHLHIQEQVLSQVSEKIYIERRECYEVSFFRLPPKKFLDNRLFLSQWYPHRYRVTVGSDLCPMGLR